MADVQGLIDEGARFYQAQEFDKAISSLESAVTEEPRKWEAWRLLGFVLNSKGDHEKATKAYEKAIEINPRDPDNYFGLALAWRDLGDLQKSIIAYEKCFHEDPHHAAARGTVAAVYEARGEELESALNLLGAEQYFEKAYKVSHSEEHYKRLLEYYERSGQGHKSEGIEHEWRMRNNIPEPTQAGPGPSAPVLDTPIHEPTQVMPAQSGAAAPPVASPPPGQVQMVSAPGAIGIATPAGTVGAAPATIQETAQGNFIPCPKCQKPMKVTANMCPHCGHDIRKPVNSEFTDRRRAAERKTWQEIVYKILCYIWLLQGLITVASGVLATQASDSSFNVGPYFIVLGSIGVFMGIGLLLEWGWMQFVAYLYCALNILGSARDILFSTLLLEKSPLLGTLIIGYHLVSIVISILFMYLLKFIGDA